MSVEQRFGAYNDKGNTDWRYLYPSLVKLGDPRQFIPDVDVWVVALGEGGLELLQLFLCESGAMSASRRCGTSS